MKVDNWGSCYTKSKFIWMCWFYSGCLVEWREGIMLTSLDAEGMKKDQLHVKNMDSISPYFNIYAMGKERL